MSQLGCLFVARVDPNIHHPAVAVLSRNVLSFPSPPKFSLFSFSCIFVSLFFHMLDDREREVASRLLSCESVVSVSESEALMVASFFVARRHDIPVLALF